MPSITKADLVLAIRARVTLADVPKHVIEGVIDALLDAIGGALVAHQRVELRGFGSFVPRQVAARKGRNPATGAEVDIPAKWGAKLKIGKELKAALEES